MLSKKLFLSSILVFVLLVFGFVVLVEASSMEWSQTYGGTSSDHAYSLVEASDGGYTIAGSTSSFGAGDTDFWLVKTDESGNMEWNKTYGGEDEDYAWSLVGISDGGCVIAASTWSSASGYDFWLIKTDESGNMEWNQTHGRTGDDIARSLVEASDGGYAIAGYTESFGAGDRDFWLIKTDESGNMEWNKTYGGEHADFATSLVEASDGGYAIAGLTWSFGVGSKDFWLIKTDESGNMEWNQTYGGTVSDGATSLVEASDGGYAIAGYTESFGAGSDDFWLIKTDESGNMEWNQTYGGTGDDVAYSLVENSDGGFILAGVKDYATHWLSFNPISGDFWLIKTDEYGNVQWNRTYGGTGVDRAYSVIEATDGGYAIAGETNSFGAGNYDAWLVKTDERGIVPEFYPPYICVDSPQNITYTTTNVSLNFTVNEETSWMGYSLDSQDNLTITEKTLTLTELADGLHTLTVYATDTDGNTGTSEIISFTISKKDETATSWTIAAIAIIAVAAAAITIYYTKSKKKQNERENFVLKQHMIKNLYM